MRYILYVIFLAYFWNESNGQMNSSLVADKKCEDASFVSPEIGGNPFYTVQSISQTWYVSMISEFGLRYLAEIFLGRPAKDSEELQQMQPLLISPYINASDTTPNIVLMGYEKRLASQCVVTNINLQFNCECQGPKTKKKKTKPEDDEDDEKEGETEAVSCYRFGAYGATIMKVDEQNDFIITAVCNAQKKRYWFAVSRKVPLKGKQIKAIKREIKLTGKFKADSAVLMEFE